MTTTDEPLTVACHVRAPMLLEPVDGHVETLRACESEGRIDSLLLRSWPEEVSLDDGSSYPEVVDVFERFERWADRHDVSVRPPFETRTARSLATGEETEMLVTPLLCLALYRGDDLVGVYPHTDGEESVAATEAIAALRTGELPPVLGVRPQVAPSDRCPECEAALHQGQGIYACPACRWTGIRREDGQFAPLRDRGDADRPARPTPDADAS